MILSRFAQKIGPRGCRGFGEVHPKSLHVHLTPKELERLANRLFEAACDFFLLACSTGLLVTMENPKNSFFWWTKWVKRLISTVQTFTGDFQVCMMGGDRDKWTRILANFEEISAMNVACDKSHQHGPKSFGIRSASANELGSSA